MYSMYDIKDLINEGITTIEETVEVELGEVMNRSFDDLIDLLDETLFDCYVPKLDSDYMLIGHTPGFYYASLTFLIKIEINAEEFLFEYFDEEEC